MLLQHVKNVTLKLSAKLGFLGYGGATHLSLSLSATPSSAIASGSTLTVASEERSEGDGITRERFLVAEREREGERGALRLSLPYGRGEREIEGGTGRQLPQTNTTGVELCFSTTVYYPPADSFCGHTILGIPIPISHTPRGKELGGCALLI